MVHPTWEASREELNAKCGLSCLLAALLLLHHQIIPRLTPRFCCAAACCCPWLILMPSVSRNAIMTFVGKCKTPNFTKKFFPLIHLFHIGLCKFDFELYYCKYVDTKSDSYDLEVCRFGSQFEATIMSLISSPVSVHSIAIYMSLYSILIFARQEVPWNVSWLLFSLNLHLVQPTCNR